MSYWKRICLASVLFLAAAINSTAQTFTTLVNFAGFIGAMPRGALVQGIDGNLYGAAVSGGSNELCQGLSGCGTIFESTTGGELSVLYTFDSTHGSHPFAAPIQGADGNFYGTTDNGGAYNGGTVFKLTSDGELATLYDLNGTSGEFSAGGLALAANGTFYGTTSIGGTYSNGTVFSITSHGAFSTLYSFCSQIDCADGQAPNDGLIQALDGNFYGTTPRQSNYGTVFKITPGGALTTLYTFCSLKNCIDGSTPNAPLLQGKDGYLYGTTVSGGPNGKGTIFRISTQGVFQRLYSFCASPSCSDGFFPQAGLTMGSDGNLYGTTSDGGSNFHGSIFEIGSRGLITLYDLQTLDGQFPSQLTQATDGNFYGTIEIAGFSGGGSLFRLSTGLPPFVKTLQVMGKVGSSVIVFGQGLTGTTSVTFNGVAATRFSVVSDTYMTAVVPAGATTGAVVVATPAGNLTSNVSFRVTR